ncbi:hypothetical protein [Sphaerisporangium aureirubrum]|uniref:Secreted protein n=1 Tax=Sphaerisporangium aureirubrum TaxID=1544736 RepID=A0ABW1NRR7_9ACTN
MRTVRTLLASAILAAGLAITLTATPAHAETLRNVYYTSSECYRVGNLGVSSGWWTYYHCDLQYNFWFLYA